MASEETECQKERPKKNGCQCHFNTLGSICYCLASLGLTAYIITTEVQQFLKYLYLPWPRSHTNNLELELHIGAVGVATLLVPFFFISSIFKTGNRANDGFRLGVHDTSCSRDPPALPQPSSWCLKTVWNHGGPTAPFLHLVISHALLMARLIMEAAAVRDEFLSEKVIWSSELSAILPATIPPSLGLPVLKGNTPSSARTSKSFSIPIPETPRSLPITIDEDSLPDDAWHIGGITWGPLTPHLINLAIAHLVYSARYSGVFWGTHKGFAFVFLLQLILNSVQTVLAFNGFQVLYKVHIVGVRKVLPEAENFLLSLPLSVFAFHVTEALILLSSLVLYFYGLIKFQNFLSDEKEKYQILSKHGYNAPWGYWPHFWSITVLALCTAAASPLVYDWTMVYRATLNSAVLVAACATVAHLFLWILVWVFLTLKLRWYFKLRVQVSKAFVTGTHSIRLVNEVQLSHQVEENEGPLMVIGAGKTYVIQDEAAKRSLMKMILNTVNEKKALGDEEEIYWLRPKALAVDDPVWEREKQSHKVSFNEGSQSNRAHSNFMNESDSSENDGDYERLRNVSFPGPMRDIPIQENSKNKLMQQTGSYGGESHDFPDPPPELTDPSTYPPPPDSPPEITAHRHLNSGSILDSSSIASSANSDKKCDSGIHSQASMSSSSGTHSKSGSSGSESCVPPPSSSPSKFNEYSSNISPRQPQNLSSRDHSLPQEHPCIPSHKSSEHGNKLNIKLLGDGYGFLPPSKYVPEPMYSDTSTPVVIRRRSSIAAVEPETPPYERSSASFSTFTEQQFARGIPRGPSGIHQALVLAAPGKALTVGALGVKSRKNPSFEFKHATIASIVGGSKGFHQPGHMDSRYFSVTAAKVSGTRVHPAPLPSPPITHNPPYQ